MILLTILSLFVISCEKPKVDVTPPAPSGDITISWQVPGAKAPEAINANDKDEIAGESGMAYTISLKQSVFGGNCVGIWNIKVDAPEKAQFTTGSFNEKNGLYSFNFTPLTKKTTYKITMTKKCSCGTDVTVILIFIVK